MKSFNVTLCAGLLLLAAGCGIKPDPPPEFPPSAFWGTGTEMAKCMEFASQSYCEQEIWGGGEH